MVKRSARIVRRLALGLAVFAGCLFLAEIALRLAGYATFHGNSYSRSDPELGWILRPNASVDVVRPDHRYKVDTNSIGLRGGELLEPARRRILLVGDSYTFGEGVEDDQTITSALQGMLDEGYGPSFEVLNAGVYGYGAIQSFGWMRRIWDQVGPCVVVYVHCGNDFADDLRHARGAYNKVRSAIPGREFLRTHSALYNVTKAGVLEILSKLGVYNIGIEFESQGEGGLVSSLGELRKQGFELTTGAVAEAAEFCRERGASFAVTTVGFLLKEGGFSLSSDARDLQEFCATTPGPIPFLDPTRGFPSTSSAAWYGQHSVGHFSPEGCRCFARSLLEGLEDAGWLASTARGSGG
jgi:hypothetical protein